MKLIKRIRCNLNEAHWIVLFSQIPASELKFNLSPSLYMFGDACTPIQSHTVSSFSQRRTAEDMLGMHLRLLFFRIS